MYKVGDKVKIKEDLVVGEFYDDSWRFVDSMKKFRGQVVTIKKNIFILEKFVMKLKKMMEMMDVGVIHLP